MIIVVPMAGHGSRFKNFGIPIPKPLIEVDGIPMFVRAARSLPLSCASLLIFAVLEEHCSNYGLDDLIREHFGSYKVKICRFPNVTSGQAETVYQALEDSSLSESVMVFNADSAFEDNLGEYVDKLAPNVSGFLQTFVDCNPRWSFVRCDSDGRVIETAEKRAISNFACTGLYYFGSRKIFADAYECSRKSTGEQYIAPIYNSIIQSGGIVLAKSARRFMCFGTPEDLDSYRNGHVFHGSE